MNTFNKKSLPAAIACIAALGATGAADAVNVNPDGLGQVLIYPYYTVRATPGGGTYNSLLSVVNSTASAKAVKVRFLEGKNSREVLDFNLFLSAHDVWTAAVIPTADGAGVFTRDNSCTAPVVSNSGASPTPFVNFAYTGSSTLDGGDTSLDRTREGYVEIIEMADIIAATPTFTTVTHVASVPPCKASILQSSGGVVTSQLNSDTVAPSGGIFGSITLVNTLAAIDVATEATALASFKADGGKLLFAEGSTLPDLNQVSPTTSVVTNGATTFVTQWNLLGSTPADAVSALFMHNNIYNEFILDAGTKSGTDWVVTMPTKRYYYLGGQLVDNNGDVIGVARTPGQTLFQRNFVSGKACDDIAIIRYDREENTITGTAFSPPSNAAGDQLCYEANVITFNNSNVLASTNSNNIGTTFENGWASLNFLPASVGALHRLVGGTTTTVTVTINPLTGVGTATTGTQGTATYFGLPTIGYMVGTFHNGTLTDSAGVKVNATFAGRVEHRFTKQIQ